MTGKVADLLNRTARHRAGLAGLARCAGGVTVLLAAIPTAIVLDAFLALPPAGLVTLDALLGGILVWQLFAIARAWFGTRTGLLGTAAYVESRADIKYSRLLNAVALADGGVGACSEPLRNQAISLGETCADHVVFDKVVDYTSVKKAGRSALVALAAVAVLAVVCPRMISAAVPRLLMPWADYPPYTRIRFAVRVEPDEILYGDSVTIHAVLHGPKLPADAEIVLRGPDGTCRRLPMAVRAAADPMATKASRTFGFELKAVKESAHFHISTATGRSAWQPLTVLPVPRFDGVRVHYEYPAYTTWPPAVNQIDTGQIRALVGTQVTVVVSSNVPKTGGTLTRYPSGIAMPLTVNPEMPQEAAATFMIEADASLEIALIGPGGEPSRKQFTAQIIAVPDRAPSISITRPEPHVMAPPNWQVPVTIVARDDIGVDRVELHRSINGWGPIRKVLTQAEPGTTLVELREYFDLAALGVQPGDVITYTATVFDNRPQTAQFADSERHTIQVISQEEYETFARTRYRVQEIHAEMARYQQQLHDMEKQRNKILERMAALEDKLREGAELTDAEAAELRALAVELAVYQQNVEALVAELHARAKQPPLYEFEAAYTDALRRLADDLRQQSADAHQVRGQINTQLRDGTSELLLAMGRFRENQRPFAEPQIQERNETAADLDKIRKATEMITEAMRIQSVIELQRQLADRLRDIRNAGELDPANRARLREIAAEQKGLKAELEDAADRLARLAEASAEQLPKMSENARKLSEIIAELEIPGDQEQAADRALAQEAAAAHEAAEAAARKLESLLGECQSTVGSAGEDLDGALGLSRQNMANALQQLMQGIKFPSLGSSHGYGVGGAQGSVGRMEIMGPANPSGQVPGVGGGIGHGINDGRNVQEVLPDAREVRPDAVHQHGGSKIIHQGIPLRYQPVVDAYFRRLAEDQKTIE